MRSPRFWIGLLLGLAILAVLALGVELIEQIAGSSPAPLIGSYHRFPRIHTGTIATSTNISLIEPWMTFGYLNRVYGLPENYLSIDLAVHDSRYPRLTVAMYAKDIGTTSPAALALVKRAVGAYLGAPQ